jgi:hypothetical protein
LTVVVSKPFIFPCRFVKWNGLTAPPLGGPGQAGRPYPPQNLRRG